MTFEVWVDQLVWQAAPRVLLLGLLSVTGEPPRLPHSPSSLTSEEMPHRRGWQEAGAPPPAWPGQGSLVFPPWRSLHDLLQDPGPSSQSPEASRCHAELQGSLPHLCPPAFPAAYSPEAEAESLLRPSAFSPVKWVSSPACRLQPGVPEAGRPTGGEWAARPSGPSVSEHQDPSPQGRSGIPPCLSASSLRDARSTLPGPGPPAGFSQGRNAMPEL